MCTYTYIYVFKKIIREKEPINLRVEGMGGLKGGHQREVGGKKEKDIYDVIQFQLKMHIIF